MGERWFVYSQPIECVRAAQSRVEEAKKQIPYQVLATLKKQENLVYNDGKSATIKIVFHKTSLLIPIPKIRRTTPIDIELPDEEFSDQQTTDRVFSNILPDIKTVVFLGTEKKPAPEPYLKGYHLDGDYMSDKTGQIFYSSDLSELDLTGLQFNPRETSYSLEWGERWIHSSKHARISTQYLGFIREKRYWFITCTKRYQPQTKEEWEQVIQEQYREIKNELI